MVLIGLTRVRGQVTDSSPHSSFLMTFASTPMRTHWWIFLTPTVLENAAVKIRFIDEGHGIHHGELTVSVFAGCRGVR